MLLKILICALIALTTISSASGLICYTCDSSINSNCKSGPWLNVPVGTATGNSVCYATLTYSNGVLSSGFRNFSVSCTASTSSTTVTTCCSYDYCNGGWPYSVTSSANPVYARFFKVSSILIALFKLL